MDASQHCANDSENNCCMTLRLTCLFVLKTCVFEFSLKLKFCLHYFIGQSEVCCRTRLIKEYEL